MSAVLRLTRARPARVMDRVGHDVARDHKEREKRAENPERAMPKKIHQVWRLISMVCTGVNVDHWASSRIPRSLRAFAITETELKLIAAPAMIGLSRRPKNG